METKAAEVNQAAGFTLINQIRAYSGLRTLERLVAYELAFHLNKDTGRCNPGYKRLAERLEVSTSAISKAVAGLKDKKVIDVIEGKGRTSSRYTFTLPPPVDVVAKTGTCGRSVSVGKPSVDDSVPSVDVAPTKQSSEQSTKQSSSKRDRPLSNENTEEQEKQKIIPEPVPSPPNPEQIKRLVGMAAEWSTSASSPAGSPIRERKAKPMSRRERIQRMRDAATFHADVTDRMRDGLSREEAEKWAREQ